VKENLEACAAEQRLDSTESASASENGLSKEEQDKDGEEEEVGRQSIDMSLVSYAI
jgi:hypothetical protein